MAKDWTGNYNSIYKTLGASNHTDNEREPNDYYATDPKAVEALLDREVFNHYIWEPACGGGHISEVLKRAGYDVRSSDLIDRGYEGTETLDFLNLSDKDIDRPRDIITNPPYKYAKEFVEKAIEVSEPKIKIAMLLKLTFLEGKNRRELFAKAPPKYIYVFSSRTKCAKNGDFESTGSSAVAYGWFIWEVGFTGEPIIKWI